ncbi:F-box/LRR-repeat protein At4g14103 [Capsella rubella]|uniref:F-box/LRR-repeat protein At4g14103 n=1 Tax=Capsella rubella TaxID=81985 RepID=UPI000CD575B3|nr:F-box/LRR-repeat protein At4g14103 [Capsella rubella]
MEAKKRKSSDDEGEGAISYFPDDLLCHILSFLPTRAAASTSLLSKRWRRLFTLIPTSLDLDDSVFLPRDRPKECRRTSFMDFVNRLLALQSDSHIPTTKFSLRCHKGVDENLVEDWIHKALIRGATDLSLVLLFPSCGYTLPSCIFFYSQNLVKLKLGAGILGLVDSFKTHRPDFIFTKLKTLHLDSIDLGPFDPGFALLLSKCPVLEELIINNANWYQWDPTSVSTPSLKRLTFDCAHNLSKLKEGKLAQAYEYPPADISLTFYYGTWAPSTVSFDTPNLLYLDYSDFVANNYKLVKLDSLVEARLDLGLNGTHVYARDHLGYQIERDATNLIMGIHNVQTLHISSDTLEVISDFCKTVPVFHKLNHLSIETDDERGWQALPLLLINCPSLQSLVFHGLHHSLTDGCGNACNCIPPSSSSSSSCLTTCPVKVLKILDFGATCGEMSLVEHFLKKLPRLEQVVIVLHSDSSQGEDADIFEVSEALEMAPRASPYCKLEVVHY